MGISYRDRRSRVCWCFMVPFVALTFGLGFMAGERIGSGRMRATQCCMRAHGAVLVSAASACLRVRLPDPTCTGKHQPVQRTHAVA